MSAQVEETVASAASLAAMATQLDELVARFQLNTAGKPAKASATKAAAATVVQRRRAADWKAA